MAVLAQYLFGTVNTGETGAGYAADTTASGVTNSDVSDGGANGDLTIHTTGTYTSNPVGAMRAMIVASTTVAEAVTNNFYIKFTVTPSAGKKISLTNLTWDIARGNTSTPRGYALRSSVDSYAANIATADVPTVRSVWTAVDASLADAAYQNLTSAITFRMYFYGPTTNIQLDFDNITLNGTVADVATGSGSATLGAIAAAGTGRVAITGSGSATLGAITGSGTGAVAVVGSGSATLGAVTGSGTGGGASPVVGSGAATLGAIIGAGAGVVPVVGAGSTSVAAITGSGAGIVAVQGLGAATLGAVTGSSAGVVPVIGIGAATLGLITGSGGSVAPAAPSQLSAVARRGSYAITARRADTTITARRTNTAITARPA